MAKRPAPPIPTGFGHLTQETLDDRFPRLVRPDEGGFTDAPDGDCRWLSPNGFCLAARCTCAERDDLRDSDPVAGPPGVNLPWPTLLGAALVGLALIAGAVALATRPAAAHSWYDAACCSGQDCAPVETAEIEETPDGYRVVLEPGDHPLVTRRLERLISKTSPDLRWSHDAGWHVCASSARIICLYIPGGV